MLSISAVQARPSLPTFLSVICLSGLNCCCLKLPPFTGQLFPVADSASTLASVTLPGAAVAADTRADTTVRQPLLAWFLIAYLCLVFVLKRRKINRVQPSPTGGKST